MVARPLSKLYYLSLACSGEPVYSNSSRTRKEDPSCSFLVRATGRDDLQIDKMALHKRNASSLLARVADHTPSCAEEGVYREKRNGAEQTSTPWRTTETLSTSRLLSLPLELRRRVFEYVFMTAASANFPPQKSCDSKRLFGLIVCHFLFCSLLRQMFGVDNDGRDTGINHPPPVQGRPEAMRKLFFSADSSTKRRV